MHCIKMFKNNPEIQNYAGRKLDIKDLYKAWETNTIPRWLYEEIRSWTGPVSSISSKYNGQPRTVKNYLGKVLFDFFQHNFEFGTYNMDHRRPLVNTLLRKKIEVRKSGDVFENWDWVDDDDNIEFILELAKFALDKHITDKVNFTVEFKKKTLGHYTLTRGTWPQFTVHGDVHLVEHLLDVIRDPMSHLGGGKQGETYWVQYGSPKCVLSTTEYAGWIEVRY